MVPNFKNGHTFINEIAIYFSKLNYVSELLTKSSSESINQNQMRDLAKITCRKQKAFRLGMWSGALSVCLLLISNLT